MSIRIIILAIALLLTSCNGEQNKALSLEYIDPVYVLLLPGSLESLNKKLAPSLENYGEVTSEDFVPQYKYSTVMQDFKENLALIMYTDEKLIPPNNLFMPMHVRHVYEAVVSGKAAVNVISVNPDALGVKNYLISQAEIEKAMVSYKPQPPLPLSILMAR